jgi:hypothetical protein
MAYRYRDTRTGRFASAVTWKRSKAHSGTRYKRERVTSKKWQEFLITKHKQQLTIAKGPEIQMPQDSLPIVDIRQVRHLDHHVHIPGASSKKSHILTGVDFTVTAPKNSTKTKLNEYIRDAIDNDYPDYNFVYELDDIDAYWSE